MQRGYERRGVATWLASAAGRVGELLGRLLAGSASSQLTGLDRADRPGLSKARLSEVRCNPGRRTVLAMALVAAVTVVIAVGWVLAARPHRVLAAVSSPAGSPISGSATAGSAASVGSAPSPAPVVPGGSLQSPLAGTSGGSLAQVVVDVVGKVRKPGVYRLPSGSRVDDAVTMAGGLLRGVDPVTVNLARKLIDGEQLLVGLVPSGGAGGSPADAGAAVPGGATSLVDLNSATLAQLDGLPGVGPVLAQRILDWRIQHGRFDSVDQLRGVSGIGDSKFADLKALVVVG